MQDHRLHLQRFRGWMGECSLLVLNLCMYSQVQLNCLSPLPLLFRYVLVFARNRVYCLEWLRIQCAFVPQENWFFRHNWLDHERHYFAKTRSSRKFNLQLGGYTQEK